MNKGFTLIETLLALSMVLLAVLFSARITIFALQQARNSLLRFRMIEKADYYKNYLSSLSFEAPELAEGGHRQENQGWIVTWQVAAGEGLKRVQLQVAAASGSLGLVFFKVNFWGR